MRRYLQTAISLLGIVSATAAPLVAQSYQSSIGWNAGAAFTTSLNEGASGGEGLVDLKPGLTWTVGGHYDRWIGGGQVGIRLQGAFARKVFEWTQGDRAIFVYTGDMDVLLRLVPPAPDRVVLPFVAAGVGLTRWSLGTGSRTTFNAAGASYSGDEAFQLVGLAGLGFDYVAPWEWGDGPVIVRLEGRDHIQRSSPFTPVNPDDSDFGIVHNFSVVLGFHTGVGILPGGE